ncbi:uncharacterized protein LOC134255974 [Saccostrea cucullata]|uniref:uncharacterized protein LOC134255974 n=1 Tax=Saccostrea cuccullata TaxID=36930 RepID=UPI002ED0F2F1
MKTNLNTWIIFLSTVLGAVFLAVVPDTTRHVTTKATTTTHRPTPEPWEFVNNFYVYDRDSHYFCVSHHSSHQHLHYCICYHIPYEDRGILEDPQTLLETEKLIFELFDAGYHVQMNLTELQFYSKRSFYMCSHTNGNPGVNTTYYLVYPKPSQYGSTA